MYPQVFGKYVLERELARGGMARVVLATLRGAGGFEKKLVVKQIRDELAFDQQFVRRFVDEAKTTVALSHPNIVPVYELGVEQGTYFLAMELVEGVSVAELLRERQDDGSRRVLSPEEGAYVGVEVCRALEYAHRRMKVVHRDITPRNVMVDEEGQVKLIDFGIAAPALVAGHEILGSPGHMAPEQVDGGELGPPTDIFAVAVLLMEAWTGSAPFRRATPEECSAAVRAPHPSPSDFDRRLTAFDPAIARAMKVDPRERQQEAGDLARELRTFLRGIDVDDLARALGDRVRALREAPASPSPRSTRSLHRASRASHGELDTKTFAARQDAIGWPEPPGESPRESEVEGAADAPSTRRVAEGSAALPPIRSGRDKADDPAMSVPTPLMVDVDELDRIHAKIQAESSSPPADKVETVATRPLETPVRAHERQAAGKRAPRSNRTVSLVTGALLVATLGLALWRVRGSAADRSRSDESMLTTTPSASSAPAASFLETPSATPPSAVGAIASLPSAQVPSGAAVTAGSSASLGKVAVTLLGDPGTRVSIDGVARGACPLRVTLDQGAHDVRFLFEPTGESRGERFTVKSGEHVTVKADFTGATPTVKIQR